MCVYAIQCIHVYFVLFPTSVGCLSHNAAYFITFRILFFQNPKTFSCFLLVQKVFFSEERSVAPRKVEITIGVDMKSVVTVCRYMLYPVLLMLICIGKTINLCLSPRLLNLQSCRRETSENSQAMADLPLMLCNFTAINRLECIRYGMAANSYSATLQRIDCELKSRH